MANLTSFGLAEVGLENRVSRRKLLKSTILLGTGVVFGAGLISACGDDADPDDTAPAIADDDEEEPADEVTDADDDEVEEEPLDDADADDEDPEDPDDPDAPRHGGTLRYVMQRPPINIDPHFDDGGASWNTHNNVYDQLVDFNREGELGPALAVSWEIAEERIYTFELREDVVFHSGHSMTADDVVFTIDRIRDPETGASLAAEFEEIESYEAVDDFTVEIALTAPFAPFLSILANWAAGIVSKEFTEQGVDYSTTMNGTGPFMQSDYETDVIYRYVRNPDYWEEGLPYLDGIDMRPNVDESARVAALRAGDADFIAYNPWHTIAEFEEDPDFQVVIHYFLKSFVRLNLSEPPLDDPLVRRALNYSVDRNACNEIGYGGLGQVRTGGLMPEGSEFYNEDLEGYYTYDPDHALELLEEAGVDPSTMHLNIRTTPTHVDWVEVVAENWRDLGIEVEIEHQDIALGPERRLEGGYQVMADGQSLPYADPSVYSVWFETGGRAYAGGTGYSNSELDELLQAGAATTDLDERRQIFRRVEEILLEDSPVIHILWRPQSEAMASYVRGYQRVPHLGARTESYHQYTWLANQD